MTEGPGELHRSGGLDRDGACLPRIQVSEDEGQAPREGLEDRAEQIRGVERLAARGVANLLLVVPFRLLKELSVVR